MTKKAVLRARIAELEHKLATTAYEPGGIFTESGCNAVLLGDLIHSDVRFMGKTYHPSWSVEKGIAKMSCEIGPFSEPTTVAQFDLVSGDTILATRIMTPREKFAAGESLSLTYAIRFEPQLVRGKFL